MTISFNLLFFINNEISLSLNELFANLIFLNFGEFSSRFYKASDPKPKIYLKFAFYILNKFSVK